MQSAGSSAVHRALRVTAMVSGGDCTSSSSSSSSIIIKHIMAQDFVCSQVCVNADCRLWSSAPLQSDKWSLEPRRCCAQTPPHFFSHVPLFKMERGRVGGGSSCRDESDIFRRALIPPWLYLIKTAVIMTPGIAQNRTHDVELIY